VATVVGSSTGAIDVKTTVSQLIEVEMVKRIDPLDAKLTAKQASLSALADLKKLSANLQESVTAFEDPAQFAATLTDAQRLTNLTTAVQDFVSKYNLLQAAIVKYGSVDVADSTRDTPAKVALYGDPALQKIRQLTRDAYSAGLSYTNPTSLRDDTTTAINFTDLGVSRKADGTLVFSKTQLNKSAALDTTDVTKFPQATQADLARNPRLSDSSYAQPKLLDRFATTTSSTFKTGLAKVGFGIVGTFDLRSSQYNSQLYTLRSKRVSASASIETERTRLLQTYTKLNSLLANMSSTSSFLTAQLASLSKNN
jgi:flagellar hook-associated protein 2